MGVRGTPLEQMELQPLVDALSEGDLEWYKKKL